jgi:alkylation response protein AidB-like acyl-CoA dehydrogenase
MLHKQPQLSRDISSAVHEFTFPLPDILSVREVMLKLLASGLGELPLPGSGATLERWRALAELGALDLSLAKIYEGHTDAIAILAELRSAKADGLWAVWAAELPQVRVSFRDDRNGGILSGQKPWCSGAAVVDYALISAWTEESQPILTQVKLDQPGVMV